MPLRLAKLCTNSTASARMSRKASKLFARRSPTSSNVGFAMNYSCRDRDARWQCDWPEPTVRADRRRSHRHREAVAVHTGESPERPSTAGAHSRTLVAASYVRTELEQARAVPPGSARVWLQSACVG